jgi:hypothetical protein
MLRLVGASGWVFYLNIWRCTKPQTLNCSTCFGRHTAHHQELKKCNAASGFTHVFGWRLSLHWLRHRSGNRQPKTYVKPEAVITVLSSWWWAVCRPKHVEHLRNTGIINFTTRLHLVCSLYEIYITMHGSMDIKVTLYAHCLYCLDQCAQFIAATKRTVLNYGNFSYMFL